MSDNTNPLLQYYRQTKLYVSLPSGTAYYTPDVLEFTDSGEVGIRSMTSSDEMSLKNPDGLLNGESVRQILLNCVVGLKDADSLLINDVDLLLIAIRSASHGSEAAMELACPSCNHNESFSTDIDYMVQGASSLKETYSVNMESGATVFVKPFTYKSSIKAVMKNFEQSKAAKAIENEQLTDEQRLALFSKSFQELAKLNYDLIVGSVIKVVDESRGVEVINTPGNKDMINEFLHNIDVAEAEKINDLIKEINNIGIDKTFPVICPECKHEWTTEVDLNPVDFFTAS